MYSCLTSHTLTCKSPALSRMFLLKVVKTARHRILLRTSPIPIGHTPGFLSKGICLDAKKASSDPSFPQYLYKHNFFATSAIALQRSQLLSPKDDEVRMQRHPFASRFDGPAAPLISHAIIYIRAPFIASYAYSSYNSSGLGSKRSLYFGAPTGCFSLKRSMFCLLVGSIQAPSVSERSLEAAFTFPDNIKLLNFLAISSIDVGLFW